MATTVLIVNDIDNIRTVMRTFLETAGCTVIEAQEAATAIEAARAHGAIDVLVTDAVLSKPRIDALELAKRLGAEHPNMRVLDASVYTGAILN